MTMSSKYAGAIYGNLALGTSAAEAAPGVIKRPARTRQQENEVVYKKPKVQVKTRRRVKSQGISAFAIVGCICIACLCLLIIMSYIRLTELSHKTSRLTAELNILKEQEDKLRLEYESAFDLNEIEDYAINILGMVKAGDNEVYYLQSRSDDKAVILDENENKKGILDTISSLLSSLANFFV